MIISGFASSTRDNLRGFRLAADAIAIPDDLAGIKLLFGHDHGKPAGRLLRLEYHGDKLWVKALLDDVLPDVRAAHFSIGGYVLGASAGVATRFLLTEISIVARPANPDCKVEAPYASFSKEWRDFLEERSVLEAAYPRRRLNLPAIRYQAEQAP